MAYHPQSICGFLLTDIMFTWQLVLLNNVNALLMLRHRKKNCLFTGINVGRLSMEAVSIITLLLH